MGVSFRAVFLIPVLFYLVERFMGKKKELEAATGPKPVRHIELEAAPMPAV